MARSIRRAGFSVTACAHRRKEPLERLVSSDGVIAAADPAAVAAASD
ncbi:MAG: NAD(P)-dependent oxidoreductase, partial [Candidatus Eremiobacteraeota bacterium]|nr:NAD(P)-dependent oxidoreductase [Candidatus Eremiobacteraeota bacterium]